MTCNFGEKGGFIVLTEKGDIWSSGGNLTFPIGKKNNYKKKRDDSYKIFGQLIKYAEEDEWWQDFLREAEKGVLPKKFSLSAKNLAFRGNEIELFPLEKVTKKAFLDLKTFLWKTSSIESPKDSEKRKIFTPQIKSEELDFSKTKLSSKKIDAIICAFINDYKKLYNLTLDDYIAIFIKLKIFISSGFIDKKTVECENGKIKNIKGLRFDPVKRDLIYENELVAPKEFSLKKKAREATYYEIEQGEKSISIVKNYQTFYEKL